MKASDSLARGKNLASPHPNELLQATTDHKVAGVAGHKDIAAIAKVRPHHERVVREASVLAAPGVRSLPTLQQHPPDVLESGAGIFPAIDRLVVERDAEDGDWSQNLVAGEPNPVEPRPELSEVGDPFAIYGDV